MATAAPPAGPPTSGPAAPPTSGPTSGPARQPWLARAPGWLFATYAGAMAFGVYFAMYAFRKPFAVAHYAGVASVGVDYKSALVIAQVLGYALSKLIGVKVIAELPATRRIIGILAQVAVAEAALVGFALIPAPWNIACLFVDGLALGMVWGMVFAFVEGRRQSELIGAMLCASFVLSSGVVKSVGEWTMLSGVNPFWMPAVTGLLFTPLLCVCLYGLSIVPPPTPADIAERVVRAPMDGAARRALLITHAGGLVALITIYVLLTALRDLRDNFAAEIWSGLGLGGQAAVFGWSELPISIVVLGAMAMLAVFRDNRAALIANLALVGAGLALTGGASLAFMAHGIGGAVWMVLVGGGLYLAYTPFNGLLFDRLMAATARAGGPAVNAGFLIYVADASGYAGSVTLLLARDLGGGWQRDWVRFLIDASLATSAIGLVLLGFALAYFHRRIAKPTP